jgi:glycosyltransferase involved in cell wall biosynthesis
MMPKERRKDIFFIQPGYAHYRDQLFSILSKRHDIHFVYESSFNVYPGEITPGEISHTFLDRKFGNHWLGLIYYLIKHQPNIVISSVSSSFRSIVSFIYAKLYRKQFILWIIEWRRHAYSPRSIKRLWRFSKNLIGAKLILGSHSLVVGGSASKQYASSLGKVDNDVFVAVQCANDLKPRRKRKEIKMKRCKPKYTFLYLSRIIPRKGLNLLIKAFSLLRMKRDDVSLLIGGDGPFRHYCEELAKSLQIHNVSFVGSVDPSSSKDLYEQADVFVLPSYLRGNQYEVWGLVINEAMSMSLPVITTTSVGAAYDLVIDGYNGFIVKENHVVDLYKAMEKIISLDLVQFGMNSRIIFEKKNDFVQMANGFTSAIEHAKLKSSYYDTRLTQ